MDGSGEQCAIPDPAARAVLRARARRIHVYAAVSGLVYAVWEYARWAL